MSDPTDLPHEDAVFDTVVVHMLHLPSPDGKGILREASRVARPMGTVRGVKRWVARYPAAAALMLVLVCCLVAALLVVLQLLLGVQLYR